MSSAEQEADKLASWRAAVANAEKRAKAVLQRPPVTSRVSSTARQRGVRDFKMAADTDTTSVLRNLLDLQDFVLPPRDAVMPPQAPAVGRDACAAAALAD